MPINEIKNHRNQILNRNYILGIDGLGAAGKTTYATYLAQIFTEQKINNLIFHMDDFIHPREVRYKSKNKEWQNYYYSQWRYNYFINEVLLQARKGQIFTREIELYNKQDDTCMRKEINVPGNAIIIIEGVFLQRSILRSYFDYIVFIEHPKEQRLERVITRDKYIGERKEIIDKYVRRYFPAEERYVKEFAPEINADYVLKT